MGAADEPARSNGPVGQQRVCAERKSPPDRKQAAGEVQAQPRARTQFPKFLQHWWVEGNNAHQVFNAGAFDLP